MTEITNILHEDLCTVMLISRWILVWVRKNSDKILEKRHKYYVRQIVSENHAVYETMCRVRQTQNNNTILSKQYNLNAG